ncbi:hypothetical protein N9Z34_02830 [Gammaproteobacteria bacterium]|nr:hypothetical protein [Gammaproteobacteria bacterium]
MSPKELVNLYLDICEDISENLIFDNSNQDKNNLYLFLSSLEQSLDFLALDVSSILNLDIKSFAKLNYLSKWEGLVEEPAIKNIIKNEFNNSDGIFLLIKSTKEKLFNPIDTTIIASNDTINLKKINLILDKYKRFMLLLRKTLEEC